MTISASAAAFSFTAAGLSIYAALVNGHALHSTSDDLKKDREIVLAAVMQNGWALEHASDDLKNDREIVLAAVNSDCPGRGKALRYASWDLKNDRAIVLAAIKQNARALDYASPSLRNNAEFRREAGLN